MSTWLAVHYPLTTMVASVTAIAMVFSRLGV